MSDEDDDRAQQLVSTTSTYTIDARLAQLRAQGAAAGLRVCPDCQQQFRPDPDVPDQVICLECAAGYTEEGESE